MRKRKIISYEGDEDDIIEASSSGSSSSSSQYSTTTNQPIIAGLWDEPNAYKFKYLFISFHISVDCIHLIFTL